MRTLASYTVNIGAAIAMLSGCGGGSVVPLSRSPAGVTPDRTLAREYSLLYTFNGFGHDGAYPQAGVINVNGTLYGTTSVGGGHGCSFHEGCGTVYRIKASGKETLLHRFKDGTSDGQDPVASLLNLNGTLYGTTVVGGAYNCSPYGGCGTVFSITPSGRETVLYSFKGGADGEHPRASLVNVNGTLYGTTLEGGAYSNCSPYSGCGTVFSITRSGKETVLYSFKGGKTDGQSPWAGLINIDGTLYGTANEAGARGHGTVFSITQSGKETVLYNFKGGTTDGQNPHAGLTHVDGTFYGTTTGGGTYNLGTVFAITSSGTETVLHSFGMANDGADPQTRLINVKGTLYGTTEEGGHCGDPYYSCGTVFSITTSGQEAVWHSFKGGTSGTDPAGGLINVNDTLYGTTAGGGSYNDCIRGYYYRGCGTVFMLKP